MLFFGKDGGYANQPAIGSGAVPAILHLCHGLLKQCFGRAAAGLEVFEFQNPTEFLGTDFEVAAPQGGVIFRRHIKAAAENENLQIGLAVFFFPDGITLIVNRCKGVVGSFKKQIGIAGEDRFLKAAGPDVFKRLLLQQQVGIEFGKGVGYFLVREADGEIAPVSPFDGEVTGLGQKNDVA